MSGLDDFPKQFLKKKRGGVWVAVSKEILRSGGCLAARGAPARNISAGWRASKLIWLGVWVNPDTPVGVSGLIQTPRKGVWINPDTQKGCLG